MPALAVPFETAPLWTFRTPNDVPLCLAMLDQPASQGAPRIVVGMDSGRVFCLDAIAQPDTRIAWSAAMPGSVLVVLPLPDVNKDAHPELVVGDDLGNVRCVVAAGEQAARELWSFASSCGIAALAAVPDVDGDDVPEIAAAGAEQCVYLRSGRTGEAIWRQALPWGGTQYVHRLVACVNADSGIAAQLVAWTWAGTLVALDGKSGRVLWRNRIDQGFTDAMTAAGDLDGDGRSEFLVGGNSGMARLCAGTDGHVLWSAACDRPIRDALVTSDVTGDGEPDALAVTAGGHVSCFSGADQGAVAPLWTAPVGDVCRAVISPGDLDADGESDVIVAAENGAVVALAGATGKPLWRWQGGDVIRILIAIGDCDGDGVADVAAASLDGTVAILSGRGHVTTAGPATTAPPPAKPAVAAKTGTAKNRSSLRAAGEPATTVPIVLYHDVVPVANYIYSTSVANFRAQMDALVEGGFTCISLDQIADWHEGEATLPARPVCITFDGPYDGHHTHAAPILRERGMFAISYITTDWIGTANHCDWHQLRELDASGVMLIENHSANHPAFSKITVEAARQQLVLCNEAIERHLGGKRSMHHAYPSGEETPAVRRLMRELGFHTATIVGNRPTKQSTDLMGLPRYTLKRDTSLETFKSWFGLK
ncbi:MAG: polysaccharide deacetylase family protein [Phycisphaerae bacterium]|nr:polysaccharide deacetylase family protein [Phycisphaerae bacterium]